MSSLHALPIASFEYDRAVVELELERLLDGPDSDPARAAMRYAVLGAGQRIRPLLALRVARMLGGPTSRDSLTAAASVELIHCASLVIDDLPCMDDDPVRRGRPATHVQFGEAAAILAAFSLVALAARSVIRMPRFQRRLLGVLDCNSLIAGQALDVTDLKTVPLFELAVQAGGATFRRFGPDEHALMRFAREFGLAFQLVDDCLDGDLADREVARCQLSSARDVAGLFGDRGGELVELIDHLEDRLG